MSDPGCDSFDLYEGLDEFAEILPVEVPSEDPVAENVKQDKTDEVNVIIDDEDDGFTFILEGDDVEPKPKVTKKYSKPSLYKKKGELYVYITAETFVTRRMWA
ncbi:hypothetical protein BEWA_000650 [Theileria equi strain WA]|uniref:Uncharacterized protein n=1 Tax=Theileria equi strain WA TaxID=1537102 RepID=L0AYL8_THEEQ|nr:hypothetical protein BEWA_000650 [Theileria equi strain WA]AFZ80660.1 hypothetical protein BEWA_000650 [Theileria equi strain WA]|eukprot:XP_004830326.1 hypothetical protein BEWA_000650 [Theileria equi strain WA]